MEITAMLWDKKMPINGRNAEFLSEHFKKANGNDDRVLIAYDGVISRIQYVNDCEFTTAEKEFMQNLIEEGMDEENAIAQTWAFKAQNEHNAALRETQSLEQLRADIDYLAIMSGLEL